jgi:peroxiredoxin Q/BCP
LRDDIERFRAAGTAVYGVNPAGTDSHREYVEGKGFNFRLLSDPDREVAARYGALKENGKSIERTVYAIDRSGRIVFAKRGIPADDEILAALR